MCEFGFLVATKHVGHCTEKSTSHRQGNEDKSKNIIFLLNIFHSKNSKIVQNANCYLHQYFDKPSDVSSNKLHFTKWSKEREEDGYAKDTRRVRPSQHLRLLSGAYFGLIRAFYNDFITKPHKDFWIRKKIVMNWFLIQLVTPADLWSELPGGGLEAQKQKSSKACNIFSVLPANGIRAIELPSLLWVLNPVWKSRAEEDSSQWI